MDPKSSRPHRLHAAGLGKLTRGMKVKLVRTGKTIALTAPQFFFAQDRSIADEAYAGDVVGIPNHGLLRIGDTLTEGEDLVFTGVPSFAPEILRRVKLGRPHEGQEAREALEQLAEEGVVQLFLPSTVPPPSSALSARCSSTCCRPAQQRIWRAREFRAGALRGDALDLLRRAKKTR